MVFYPLIPKMSRNFVESKISILPTENVNIIPRLIYHILDLENVNIIGSKYIMLLIIEIEKYVNLQRQHIYICLSVCMCK